MGKLSDVLRRASRKSCSVVVLGAGDAQRMGSDKMLLDLDGVPVLIRSLLVFQESEWVDEILVVTKEEKLETVSQLCRRYEVGKVSAVIRGGKTRTESALAGVLAVSRDAGLICIHDGARPLVSREIVEETIRAGQLHRSAAPAVGVSDTIRVLSGDTLQTPDREKVYAMQTPQVFESALIKAALTKARDSGQTYTDDCGAVEAIGVVPHLTKGSEENLKITTPADMVLAEYYLRHR